MPSSRNLVSIIRAHFGPSRGVDLELPSREPIRTVHDSSKSPSSSSSSSGGSMPVSTVRALGRIASSDSHGGDPYPPKG